MVRLRQMPWGRSGIPAAKTPNPSTVFARGGVCGEISGPGFRRERAKDSAGIETESGERGGRDGPPRSPARGRRGGQFGTVGQLPPLMAPMAGVLVDRTFPLDPMVVITPM